MPRIGSKEQGSIVSEWRDGEAIIKSIASEVKAKWTVRPKLRLKLAGEQTSNIKRKVQIRYVR